MATKASALPSSLSREPLDLHLWGLEAISWDTDRIGPCVLLIPGHFCPRNFWFPRSRDGFGDWLYNQGFNPVALTDALDNQLSTETRRTSDWVFHILPRVIGHLAQSRNQKIHVVGYSAGGAYALASASLLQPQLNLASLAVVGTQVSHHQESQLTRRALRLLGRLPIRLNGRWLGLPVSHNSALELSEYVDTKAGEPFSRTPLSSLRAPASITIHTPLLSLSSSHDVVAPPEGCKELFERVNAPEKRFQMLENNQTQRPIQHFELFARRHREQVWPILLDWLRRRAD